VKRAEIRRLGAAATALAIASVTGYVAAAVLAAPSRVDPCRSLHTCPSDHATSVWTAADGQGRPADSKPPPPPPTTTEPGTLPTTTAPGTTTGTLPTTTAPATTAPTTTGAATTATTAPATTVAPTTTHAASPPQPPSRTKHPTLGKTVLLARRTKTSGCKRGPSPDRRCSPGAYYSALTKSVICSAGFRPGSIGSVSTSIEHAIEREYGMAPRSHGSSLEIDRIVPLGLGGSNAPANLFPQPAPAYHVKDRLERRLHTMVCSGKIGLRTARAGIARNWQSLYAKVFGLKPSGLR
jgi:hypothetical protein